MNLMKDYQSIIGQLKKEIPMEIFERKELYADWLAQTYYFVCHSTALLGYSLPHLRIPELRHRFEKHISEEERHELLAKKDLEKLGYRLEDLPEHATTQAFYQSQYYRIQFEDGASLLGYILFLEGIAVLWGKDAVKNIKQCHKGSTLFLEVHANEDPHHLEEAIKSIGMLPQHTQDAIRRNFNYSAEIYIRMMQSILEKSKVALKAA